MQGINRVTLIGNLVKDSELKYTASGSAVCKFTVAVNRRKKNGDQWEDSANFFDITVWNKQAEMLGKYLLKGKLVGIDGELRQERWEKDGYSHSKVTVEANYIQLLSRQDKDDNFTDEVAW